MLIPRVDEGREDQVLGEAPYFPSWPWWFISSFVSRPPEENSKAGLLTLWKARLVTKAVLRVPSRDVFPREKPGEGLPNVAGQAKELALEVE